MLFVLVVAAFSFGMMTAVASEIPQLDPARNRPQVDSVIYASNGYSVLAVLRGEESRVLVTDQQIAPIMKQAIVAVEDERFYDASAEPARTCAGPIERGVGAALVEERRSRDDSRSERRLDARLSRTLISATRRPSARAARGR